MAYTTINKSTDHFNTKLYTGNGSNGHSITGVGFQPDFVWIKNRSAAEEHLWYDSVRGADKLLRSNNVAADATTSTTTYFNSFNSDGFTVGSETGMNANSQNIVAWNWKAETAFSNSAGANGATIASSGRVNTTAGFSIVSFVGNATSGATVAHGLGSAPQVVIIKSRDSDLSWRSYFAPLGATHYIELDAASAGVDAANFMNDTAPTSNVFSLGNGTTPNKNGDNYVAYCFAEKTGYSKFGGYTGNDNADGPFAFTGFKPSFVLFKRTAGSAANWQLWDNKRDTYNPVEKALHPDISNTASADQDIDFLSNGFKVRSNQAHLNNGGTLFVYMAFGQSLVGSNNVPCTAR
jgi:hypothetical protein